MVVTEEGRGKLSIMETLMGSLGVAVGMAWGLPLFMAPELWVPPLPAIHFWCLVGGVLVYELTTGTFLFKGEEFEVVEDKILRGPFHIPYSTLFVLCHLLTQLLHQDSRQRAPSRTSSDTHGPHTKTS